MTITKQQMIKWCEANFGNNYIDMEMHKAIRERLQSAIVVPSIDQVANLAKEMFKSSHPVMEEWDKHTEQTKLYWKRRALGELLVRSHESITAAPDYREE